MARTDGPNDRRALAAVAVQFTINGLAFGTWIPRLPEVQERVGVTVGVLGVILALGTGASLVSSFLTGAVMSRFDTRNVLTVAAALSTTGTVAIGFAQQPAVLIVGLMLFSASDVFADVSMNLFGSELSERRKAPVMNRLHGLWSLGTVAGGFITIVVVRNNVSVPTHFVVTAAVLVAAILFVRSGLPASAPGLEDAEDGAESAESQPRAWGIVVALGIGGLAAIALEIVASDWATFRLGRDLGASNGVAVAGFVSVTVGMMLGRFGGDSVQVRAGREAMTYLAGGLALTGAALATLVSSVPVSLVGFVLLGLGTSVLFPQLYDAAAKAPGRRGSGFTALLIGQRFGGTVVPISVAALADTDALDFGVSMAVWLLPMGVLVLIGGRTMIRLAPVVLPRRPNAL